MHKPATRPAHTPGRHGTDGHGGDDGLWPPPLHILGWPGLQALARNIAQGPPAGDPSRRPRGSRLCARSAETSASLPCAVLPTTPAHQPSSTPAGLDITAS